MSDFPNLGRIFYKDALIYPENDRENWITQPKAENLSGDAKKTALKDRENHTKNVIEKLQAPISKNNNVHPFSEWINGDHEGLQTFDLQTQYPGLLIGAGYTHEVGLHGELKLGFYFDYTSGLPVIPGSSVKGVLRSVFPGSTNDKEGKKNRLEFLKELIQMVNSRLGQEEKIPKLDEDQLSALEQNIFEGKEKKGDKWEATLSMYKRDLFYDAIASHSEHTSSDQSLNNVLFGTDFITPHKSDKGSQLDPFAAPTPIQFLKVLPGVTFKFFFKLNEFKISDNVISPDHKWLLFREILLLTGIGAKTNVGYGHFVLPSTIKNNDGSGNSEASSEAQLTPENLKQGDKIEGNIIDPAKREVLIKRPQGRETHKLPGRAMLPKKGSRVILTIGTIKKDGTILQLSGSVIPFSKYHSK